MKKMLITAFAAAAALSSAAYAEPRTSAVHAETGALSLRVSYGDLDLSRPAGAKVMLRRIKNAADQVCGGKPNLRNLAQARSYRQCIRESTENAVFALNEPLVTAIHADRVGNGGFARN